MRSFWTKLPVNGLRVVMLAVVVLSTRQAFAQSNNAAQQARLATQFRTTVAPFLKKHCLSCHGEKRQEAKLSLANDRSMQDVARRHQVWDIVLERIEAGEMPPEDANPQPTTTERKAVVEWIRGLIRFEADRNAGDPGVVLARRLSNAEYNYSVRDLTGVDIRPTATFPVDPANEAGFDNSGESLAMSPALLKKYLEAARQVSEHMVMAPSGVAFAPHPAVTNTDRDKYCVRRIVDFYHRQPTDLSDYFLLCWKAKSDKSKLEEVADIEAAAHDSQLSPAYAARVWRFLNQTSPRGPGAKLKQMLAAIPADSDEAQAQAAVDEMKAYVANIRRRLAIRPPNLNVPGSHKGSQPFVLWKNREYAAHRQRLNQSALFHEGSAPEDAPAELTLPQDDESRAKMLRDLELFCELFPDRFYVSERGRDYLDVAKADQEKGRLLSAGFHSMMGYFRDDAPLYALMLNEAGRQEIDGLWDELNMVARAPSRQYSGFLWFERTDSRYMRDPEFDFARPENKSAAEEKMIRRLAKVYLAKAERAEGTDVALQAITHFFEEINGQISRADKLRRQSQPVHRAWLADFAARAWRRRLAEHERQSVVEFYDALREQEHMSHEDAMRDSCVSILMSPFFLYRMDLASGGKGVRPLNATELASRLSYFLWSSTPDDDLLELTGPGEVLLAQEQLESQVRRMLADPKMRALSVEFAANWLDVRRFEEHNAVDRERFPEFDDTLRNAMFEEPIRFLDDLVRRDGSILELLDARHTFVNRPLAQHYGMEAIDFAGRTWARVERADQFQRGGLLTMAVFLTKNSPGLRTSPVKRGYWVVRRLLGERIPPPPPNVPELPADESQLGDLSLREMLAKHRDNKSCAGCHDRFDAIGLAFEGFGPVGRTRTLDLGGRPVQTDATFPGGVAGGGVVDLRTYLKEHRQDEFIDNFCRKLTAYALGRTLMLSDEALIAKMKRDLAENDFRFSHAVRSLVFSRQFLYKHGDAQVVKEE